MATLGVPLAVPCTIKCTGYGLVADLSGSNIDEGIIGFKYTNVPNQKWTILYPQNFFSGNMTISTMDGTASPHVTNANLKPGAKLQAAAYRDARPWRFDPVDLSQQTYRIYCFACDGSPLFWTLRDGTEKTLVVLDEETSSSSQIWQISPA